MRRHRQAAPKWRPLGGRLGAERMRMIVTHVKPNYLAPAPSPRLPHRDSAKSAWNAAGPDLDHRLKRPALPYFTPRDDALVERAADGPFTTVKCPGNAHRTKPNRKSGRGTAELESVVQTTRAQGTPEQVLLPIKMALLFFSAVVADDSSFLRWVRLEELSATLLKLVQRPGHTINRPTVSVPRILRVPAQRLFQMLVLARPYRER